MAVYKKKTVCRVQILDMCVLQVIDLEAKLNELQKETKDGLAPHTKKDPSEYIPRPPERCSLSGHRSTITRVIFHPVYSLVISAAEDSTIKVG